MGRATACGYLRAVEFATDYDYLRAAECARPSGRGGCRAKRAPTRMLACKRRRLPSNTKAFVTNLNSAPAAQLRDLLRVAGCNARLVPADADAEVRDVTHDSRQAGPGVLYACRPGHHADGHDFAPAAVAAGSPALLVQRLLDQPVPQLQVPDVADVLGPVAARVHHNPSAALTVCGITGTNGKTTTAYLLESVLRAAGHRTGMIGTVQTLIAGQAVPGVRTTPEATDLQRLLARMRGAGVTATAMEVSSHGLALGRVAGTQFAVALFTNLSQDHLDFHADLEDYFQAKARLFTSAYTPTAVINVDDPYGRRLAQTSDAELVAVSPSGAAGGDAATATPADVTATDVQATGDGCRFVAHLRSGSVVVRTPLVGDFNVANALCAMAAAEVVGVDLATAAAGIAACDGVPGRMEAVDAGQPFTVLVDYAHTPDSLERVLVAARGIIQGRTDRNVVVVVGCGGERDTGKRPLMGRVAARLADLAILTSDNPRGEDPSKILAAVAGGAAVVHGAHWQVVIDRRDAIATALNAAGPGDVVIIAGKGHETYQELGDRTVDFDDRLVARALLTATKAPGESR
jgi:UDP-N-acetylmuramoyl-L-alanyl-D-glutamate--2,6-diaminopimelate ligase